MATLHERSHASFEDVPHMGYGRFTMDWPTRYRLGYSLEDDWMDQLEKLPSPEDVATTLSQLRAPVLREFSIDVTNGVVNHLRFGNRLELARLLNSWMATAEETVVAGGRGKRIKARRKHSGK